MFLVCWPLSVSSARVTDGQVYLENVTKNWGGGGEEGRRQVPKGPRGALGGQLDYLWFCPVAVGVVRADIVQRESGSKREPDREHAGPTL